MSTTQTFTHQLSRQRLRRYSLYGVACATLVLAIALDTRVVRMGSSEDVQQQVFSPDSYGSKTFPLVRQAVESRAVDAVTLATALKASQQAAVKQYGVGAPLPVFSVKLNARVEPGQGGLFPLRVEGMPEGIRVRLQTGPAITGTELRDASGTIQFGDFKNQIEYQNAGSAINRAMKAALLDKLDRATLAGKTVQVTGVFRLLNPDSWLVTPVSLEVK